jgi:hypothetical protein
MMRCPSKLGSVPASAESTARGKLSGPTAAAPFDPPQGMLRTEHESPDTRDAQRHDAPHIEQVDALPT